MPPWLMDRWWDLGKTTCFYATTALWSLRTAGAHHVPRTGPVLALAEPDGERGVGLGGGVDVRDAPLVAADGDRGARPLEAEFPGRDREPAAEREAQEQTREVHSDMVRSLWEVIRVSCEVVG